MAEHDYIEWHEVMEVVDLAIGFNIKKGDSVNADVVTAQCCAAMLFVMRYLLQEMKPDN